MRLIASLAMLIGVSASVIAEPGSTTQTRNPQLEHVLRYVPDDAHLVIVAPRVSTLDRRLETLGKRIGVPQLGDKGIADFLQQALGTRLAALDQDAPAVIAASATDCDPLLIGLINPDPAWRRAAETTAIPGHPDVFDFGDDGYVALAPEQVGVFAREQSELQRALRSTGVFLRRLKPGESALLTSGQLGLHVYVPAWRDQIEQQLRIGAGSAYMGMAASGPDAQAALDVTKWMFDQALRIVDEAETYVVAARASHAGVSLHDQVSFKSGGSVANYLRQVRASQRDLFRGLPENDAAVVFACEWELPPGTESINEALVKVVTRGKRRLPEADQSNFEAAMQHSLESYQRMTGYNAAVTVPPAGEGLFYYGLYLTDEPEKVRQDVRASCQLCPDLMEAWGGFPSAKIDWAQERIGRRDADVYRFAPVNKTASPEPMSRAIYGPSPSLYMASAPAGLAYALGAPDAARRVLDRMLAENTPPLRKAARVNEALNRLSPQPQFCMLVDIPRSFQLVARLTQAMGVPFPRLPKAQSAGALAGYAFYIRPEGLRGELFVPSESIKLLVELGEGKSAK